MSTFDPKLVNANFGPVIFGDYAKGTFIKVATDGDAFTTERGADGKTERINNNNNLLTVEITLKQTSTLNDALSAIHQADKLTNGGVFPFAMKDGNNNSLVLIPKCYIKKMPDFVGADSLQPRTWVLEGDGTMFVGGNS